MNSKFCSWDPLTDYDKPFDEDEPLHWTPPRPKE